MNATWRVCALSFLVMTALGPGTASAAKPPMIGFLNKEAVSREAEWRQRTGYYKALAENGMQGALTDSKPLFGNRPTAPGEFYRQLKGFHAVVLCSWDEVIPRVITPELRQRMLVARADLERYVKEGGGLLVNLKALHNAGGIEGIAYNLLTEPFGVRVLREGINDQANLFISPATAAIGPQQFFSTTNFNPRHPIAQGLKRLYLPVYHALVAPGAESGIPGVEALGWDGPWETVVAGEATARSYPADDNNYLNLKHDGSQKSAPAIAITRTYGRGRVFVYDVSAKDTFLNYGNPNWPQITERTGDQAHNRPSDGNKLLINALRWVSKPSLKMDGFGTYTLKPIEPIKFPATVNFDPARFGRPTQGVRGITGAHSNYSDGEGTVAQYATAAKAAALSFIIFTDPMELMSDEKLQHLKDDCAKASAPDFYVCPGMDFSDAMGVRWAAWGEWIPWPSATFVSGGRQYPVWDGRRIVCRGQYGNLFNHGPMGIIDYKALRSGGGHPVNLWWFYQIFPFVYEGDRLIADNTQEYLYALRDLRGLQVGGFTRIRSPRQVAEAARACVTSVKDLATARVLLNKHGAGMYEARAGLQAVSQGPRIEQWDICNPQIVYPWQKTRGAQRVRLRFQVSSGAGIAEVKVHDADFGLIRRFLGHGAQTLARDFEMVHDRQRYLTLEVVDGQNKRAISACHFLYCYKSGLYRCGDNLNTLGSAQLIWHPDRNQMPSMVKFFENGFSCQVDGIDTGAPLAPQPSLTPLEGIHTSQGLYPNHNEGLVTKLVDIPLASTDLQIYATDMCTLSEGYYGTTKWPEPARGPTPRILGPLKFFERSQITYATAGRVDYFTSWDYRRPWEGSRDYRGSILWHEGQIRFKQDLALRGHVPVPLITTSSPGGAALGMSDHFYVTDRDQGLMQVVLQPGQRDLLCRKGHIRPGGYCATLNTTLGYYGFFASSDSDFTYVVSPDTKTPDKVGTTTIGMGEDGQQVKAGTVWKYRFALAVIADDRKDNVLLEDMAQAYNFDGGRKGYAATAKVGQIEDLQYFLTARAQGNEAVLTAGHKPMICDLPFRIKGIEDNGCTAIYVKGREFFRFVAVTDQTAYFQEPIDKGTQLWVGNPFVCADKPVKLTLVVDGQTPGKAPRLEVHNPTDKPIATKLYSPPHTPRFGGIEATVTLPAGDSVFYEIDGKQLKLISVKS